MTQTPREQLDPDYLALVESASLDWLVMQYVRAMGKLTEHSAWEIKAAAIADVARSQYGAAFDSAVESY